MICLIYWISRLLGWRRHPYGAVTEAIEDLEKSDFSEKWLVVVSDGAFDGVEDAQVQADRPQPR